MKLTKLIFAGAVLTLIACMATGCTSKADKVGIAENNVAEANRELAAANDAYLDDVEMYRRETAATIARNNKSIRSFHNRIDTKKTEAAEEYRKKITELELENTDMEMRIESYRANGRENWQSFKKEFNSDMERIGAALNDLTVTNVK